MRSSIEMYKRIGGQQLGQHVNSDIVLLGQIKKISSNGKAVELATVDNVPVNVNLPEPIDGNCEGYIEVYGTALSKSTVSCKRYVHFPPELSNNFESEKYNAFLSTLHVIGDKKWKISADDEPY
ncbi:hypothetical protein TSAR_008775 [Trichomalopsis sarcophagae]|uniref:Replication protein A 14 kDa subunit n=1 Tax=Trichomalopsis sarcophagae TaxID=543379 RepID=A0A232FJ65_9HYME|nr:hypothetical protein TSAR_008775 [Trichomalopsis sarcophagae]